MPWISLKTIQTTTLQNNLSHIEVYYPELRILIKNAVDSEDIWLQEESGLIRCRAVHNKIDTWIFGGSNSQSELLHIRDMAASIPSGTKLLVLNGNSAGYLLAQIIPTLLKQAEMRILIQEISAARIYACMVLLDIRAAISTGRLHFSVGESTLKAIIASLNKYNLFGFESPNLLNAPETILPVPGDQFLEEYRQASENRRQLRDILKISLATKSAAKDKNKKIERVLLIDCWPGAPGEAHLKAIQNALRKRGIQTSYHVLNRYQIDAYPKEYRRMIEPGILSILDRFQPDLVISYGYHAPKFLEQTWFERSGAVWLQSVSNIAYYDTNYYPEERTALIEENLIPYFKKRGCHNPFFIPIMADYTAGQPVRTSRQAPVVFIGNCLGLAPTAVEEFMARWQAREGLRKSIIMAESILGDFGSGTNLYDYLRDNPMPQIDTEEEDYAVFRYLLCQGSAARRRTLLEKIAHLGLQLFGGDWPAYLPPDSPLHACYRGYLPLHEEIKAFQIGHIFVNIHSVGHVTGPNMRFFNVPGMGGFQITDGPLFSRYLQPDAESVFFITEDDFLEKVTFYRSHYKEADEIRFEGQKRIQKNWSYDQWVEKVFAQLQLSAPPENG